MFRRLTVEQNIRAVLELQLGPDGKPLPTAKINQQMESLLEELQIGHIRSNAAISLSGGERRRVKSRARWPPARASSCWTNPSPAWTPSR